MSGPADLWASNDLGALFSGDEVGVTPWPRAPRRKDRPLYDRALVEERVGRVVTFGDDLQEVDPRELWCSQPGLVRSGVAHYLTDEWRRIGRTWADQHIRSNQYPLVYVDSGRRIILAGHHRSAAALLAGTPVLARLVDGPLLAHDGAVVVTPRLHLAESGTPAEAVAAVEHGEVGQATAAGIVEALRLLGADEPWAIGRLRLATQGR